MLFKDIKQNYPVYILDKSSVTTTQGKVVSVSFPRMENMNMGQMSPAKTVVDVVIEADGKTATYTIPENLSVTFAGNLVLSTDRDGLLNEVEAMKNAAEQVLQSVDRQKEIVEKSTKLLSELNPAFREKVQNEERFGKIEGCIEEIKNKMGDIDELKNMMTNFIKEFKS